MKKLVVLKDRKSRSYGVPIAYDSIDSAVRELDRSIKVGRDLRDGQRPLLSMYPEDFELWHIADFDADTGVVTPVSKVIVCHASDLVSSNAD